MDVRCTCGMCQGGCAVVAQVEGGRLVGVSPDRDSPRRRLCPLGHSAPDSLYREGTRILHPLVRDGAHGHGKLRRTSWDEALDRAAELLRGVIERDGARALASYYGRGVLGMPVMTLGAGPDSPLRRLGSPNDFTCCSICNLASYVIAPQLCLGFSASQLHQDIEHADVVFVWGRNPLTDEGPQDMARRIREARARGARLVVIDPRQGEMGRLADQWVPVTPGSDGALALAMLKIIVEQGCCDREFVEHYTRGFEPLRAHLAALSLEHLSRCCGVSVEDICALAELFCSTTRICLVCYTGLEYAPGAIQSIRALYALWALTGKLDVPGGMLIKARAVPTTRPLPLPTGEGALPIGAREFPLGFSYSGHGQFSRVPHAVLEGEPYPVRGLLVFGGSPALSFPDRNRWRRSYQALDALVVTDLFMTEETRFADVVLPARSLYETARCISSGRTEPVIAPVGEARDDVLILADIARRLGVGEGLPRSEDELATWLDTRQADPATRASGGAWAGSSAPAGNGAPAYVTGELRADGKPGFPTPSGLFELASSALEDYGMEPLPVYRDVRELPGLGDARYPLTLTTGARDVARMGVLGPSLPAIARLRPAPVAQLSDEDAGALGIADKDEVRVETPFGSARFTAHVGGMARGAVHVPHGGGGALMAPAWREGGANQLTSLDVHDPISGFAVIKSLPCRVERVAG